MKRELTNAQAIERSTIKKYRKELWNPFIAAVKRYELIQENDKVAVCVSGGKDSWLLAVLMKHLQTHSEVPFELKFISMDPGYNKENRRLTEENAKLFDIPLKIFETDIFSAVDKTEKNPCYLCARMRRGHLYSKAKELGCNKIALGHHMSDVIETTVLAMLYGSQLQAMPPKLHSTNFEGMELIRPLYCVNGEDIIKWRDYNNLNFLNCACKFAKEKKEDSKREEIKQLIKDLKETNPNIENSIFSSIHNLHFDTFPAYRTKGEDHTFLENYYT